MNNNEIFEVMNMEEMNPSLSVMKKILLINSVSASDLFERFNDDDDYYQIYKAMEGYFQSRKYKG